MKVTEFSRKICRELSEEIFTALEPVAQKYNLTLEKKGGSFTLSEWTHKIIFKVGDEEIQEEAAKQKFASQAFWYGLKPDDYGKTLMLSGRQFKITGIKPRASKKPILIERDDGRIFVISDTEVRKQLGRKDENNSESIVLTSKDVGTLNLSDLEGE